MEGGIHETYSRRGGILGVVAQIWLYKIRRLSTVGPQWC